MGYMSQKDLQYTAERLASAKVGIASSVPFRNMLMPLPQLRKAGVEVLTGNDNVQDHWGPLVVAICCKSKPCCATLWL
ncbi:hypothetical protein KUH03_38400 [Sphingobacterium sp. E70]|uniref:hypothetical protein n=1 Tax=Sphingobacterium sp. E70 TaxID=2853439 RepID=UPI00211C5C5A|nr:hypothetical protein [Sphingobacterium sp. E70]ULT24724.1 hypothetical protein KUH03_38400 [Sphingobacterium sp. E70]